MDLYTPEVLIKEEEIKLRVQALANAITKDFADSELTVICVLKGAFVFCSDLIRKIQLPVKLDFISVSSYGEGMESSGEVKLNLDLSDSISGKNILLVEDIIDTGLTINYLKKIISQRNPREVKLASLLYKPTKIKYDISIDYLAFEIEDKFVVGYGLDYAGRYRELPYIGILNASH